LVEDNDFFVNEEDEPNMAESVKQVRLVTAPPVNNFQEEEFGLMSDNQPEIDRAPN